jgi:hypothetical protein
MPLGYGSLVRVFFNALMGWLKRDDDQLAHSLRGLTQAADHLVAAIPGQQQARLRRPFRLRRPVEYNICQALFCNADLTSFRSAGVPFGTIRSWRALSSLIGRRQLQFQLLLSACGSNSFRTVTKIRVARQ